MVQRIERRIGIGLPLLAFVALVALMTTLGASEAFAAEDSAEAIRPPIDINVANATELTRLPGVGETTAKRIIAFREQNGPFGRVEDLMKVKGIGEKSFQKLRPSITVGKARS